MYSVAAPATWCDVYEAINFSIRCQSTIKRKG